MKKIYIFMALLLLITPLMADETEGKFTLGLKGGLETYWGDINDQQIKPVVNGSLFYWLSDNWALGFNGGWGYLLAEGGTKYFKTDIYNLNLMVKWKLSAKSPLNPFLTTGLEVFSVNPKAANGNILPNLQAEKYDKTNLSIPVGIGFSIFLSENFALDLEGMHHFSTTDYLDDISKGSLKDGWTTAMIGLSLYLGEPKDTDKDGIPDKLDSDPFHREDFDGFQDDDGAPDYDNDNDGVLDKDDKEPNNPEDKDGFEDNDGIPDPDNDQDGILDINDKEPDMAEDMDGFQDDDGAPDPDNDGDGILDAQDKCPNEAETVNGYKDEDGCPDTKPEIAVGTGIVLEGVNFESGKSILTENSKTILNNVVRTLTENPLIEVEIRGYTDNTGSYKTNEIISLARANAVKAYLVQNGISSGRILTFGYGPEKPIAPNTTREGRAKNRRIEFFRFR
jgi:outer membrane protein OmpA-like peptidoglycan-associated protein/opacity protein-like surface antigen